SLARAVYSPAQRPAGPAPTMITSWSKVPGAVSVSTAMLYLQVHLYQPTEGAAPGARLPVSPLTPGLSPRSGRGERWRTSLRRDGSLPLVGSGRGARRLDQARRDGLLRPPRRRSGAEGIGPALHGRRGAGAQV